MLVVTWNVNSLNTRLDHLRVLTSTHAPDVVCMQETKCSEEGFPWLEVQALGYEVVAANGGGREGVAIFARQELGITDPVFSLDGHPRSDEARWVEATIGGVRIVSVYVINGRARNHPVFADKLAMLDRMRERVAELSDEPLIVTGDFNIAPRDEDVWDLKKFGSNSTHVSPQERSRLQAILDEGVVDAWDRTPERGEHEFTWWDYRMGAFHKNMGLRIDLALVTPDIADRLTYVGIDRDLRKNVKEVDGVALPEPAKPSDHAPLLVRFDDL